MTTTRTIKFGTKVVRKGDSNRTEMLVTNVSSTGGLVGCIWRLPGAWFSADRFTAEQLEIVGEYEPSAAQAMRMSYEQG
jgi:hypothetical protein